MKQTTKTFIISILTVLLTGFGYSAYSLSQNELFDNIIHEAQVKSSKNCYFEQDYQNDIKRINANEELRKSIGKARMIAKLHLLITHKPICTQEISVVFILCAVFVGCVFLFILVLIGTGEVIFRFIQEQRWRSIQLPKLQFRLGKFGPHLIPIMSTQYFILRQKAYNLLSEIINPPEKPPCFCCISE